MKDIFYYTSGEIKAEYARQSERQDEHGSSEFNMNQYRLCTAQGTTETNKKHFGPVSDEYEGNLSFY